MPLYEYYCPVCRERFELLRPMSAAAESATCPDGHPGAGRTVSVFSALTTNEFGQPQMMAGGCGCGGACSCGAA